VATCPIRPTGPCTEEFKTVQYERNQGKSSNISQTTKQYIRTKLQSKIGGFPVFPPYHHLAQFIASVISILLKIHTTPVPCHNTHQIYRKYKIIPSQRLPIQFI